MTIVAAAMLGLLGSSHCLVMCGPLILAVGSPRRGQTLSRRLAHIGSYHAGRVCTYALLGVAAGAAGGALALAGLGRALAVAAGVLLLTAGLWPAVARRWSPATGAWMSIVASASAAARRWQARHSMTGAFAAGLVNGLLPCGMVYAALALSLGASRMDQAVWTMSAFGAGTVPALAALSLGAGRISPGWRRRLAHAMPLGLVVVGALLLVRGFSPPPVARGAMVAAPLQGQPHRH